MRKQDLQNEKLDEIRRKLLEATLVSDKEIERIVAAPQLFEAVKMRINKEQQTRKAKGFGIYLKSPLWNWRVMSTSAAVLLILIFGAASQMVFRKPGSSTLSQLAEKPAELKNVPKITLVEIPPPQAISEDVPPSEISKDVEVKNRKSAQQIVLKNEQTTTQKSARKPNSSKSETKHQSVTEEEFYPLTFAGNPGEDGEDLQIIRAEFSPSSLFALGLNLSVENETAKVKADLLVSADGVTRAIRLVK
jgi:hypothetical protein